MKSTILIDRADDMRLYEPDKHGGVDEYLWTPQKFAHMDNIDRDTFARRSASAYRVFVEVAK